MPRASARKALEWAAILLVVGRLAQTMAGCSSSSAHVTPVDGGDDESDAPVAEAEAGDAANDDAEASPRTAYLRIAHASPDSPALDVCIAAHGTSAFEGPLVAQLAASLASAAGIEAGAGDDGGLAGIPYSQVSAYVPLAPGRYDVRLVPAGASSCSPPQVPEAGTDATLDAAVTVDGDVGGDASSAEGGAAVPTDWTNLPSLAESTYTTLLIAGEVSPVGSDASLDVNLLTDDSMLAGGLVALRVINAIPSWPSLDFGYDADADWLPLLTNVAFGSASAQAGPGESALDPNGYIPLAPIAAQAVSVRPSGADAIATAVTATNVEIDMGSIATLVALGGKTGDGAHPAALLLCLDNQPAGGLLSDCSVAP